MYIGIGYDVSNCIHGQFVDVSSEDYLIVFLFCFSRKRWDSVASDGEIAIAKEPENCVPQDRIGFVQFETKRKIPAQRGRATDRATPCGSRSMYDRDKARKS